MSIKFTHGNGEIEGILLYANENIIKIKGELKLNPNVKYVGTFQLSFSLADNIEQMNFEKLKLYDIGSIVIMGKTIHQCKNVEFDNNLNVVTGEIIYWDKCYFAGKFDIINNCIVELYGDKMYGEKKIETYSLVYRGCLI